MIGTDISVIQPVWCPPNLTFEIDDATQDWTFAPNSFDYVHIRYMLGSIQDWPRLFKQAYTALKPGGYVESYESEPKYLSDDGTVTPDSAMSIWTKLFADGGKKLNRPFTILTDNLQQRAIEEAGFIDIQVTNSKVKLFDNHRSSSCANIVTQAPIGGWAQDPRLQEIGQYAQLALEQDLEGNTQNTHKPLEERLEVRDR